MRRMGIQEKYIFAYFVKVRDLLQLLVYYSIKLTFALKFSVAITCQDCLLVAASICSGISSKWICEIYCFHFSCLESWKTKFLIPQKHALLLESRSGRKLASIFFCLPHALASSILLSGMDI